MDTANFYQDNKIMFHYIYHYFCIDGFYSAMGSYFLHKALGDHFELKLSTNPDGTEQADILIDFYYKKTTDKLDIDFIKFRAKKLAEYKHIFVCVDTSLVDTTDLIDPKEATKTEIYKMNSLMEDLSEAEIDYQIHMIDHHLSAYEYHKSDKNTFKYGSSIGEQQEYIDKFIDLIKNGFERNTPILYCYSFSNEISAGQMVYDIAISILHEFTAESEFFSNPDIKTIYNYVGEYDTGRAVDKAKEFVSGFYSSKPNLDVRHSIDPIKTYSNLNIDLYITLGK